MEARGLSGALDVFIYTDGACSGNPGLGGWAAILLHPASGQVKEIKGWEHNTTNNRMELLAVIRGLEALKRSSEVVVKTDSQYLVGTMTQGWKRRANLDLWARLDELCRAHRVEFEWLKGHDGDSRNERADHLARVAIAEGRMNL